MSPSIYVCRLKGFKRPNAVHYNWQTGFIDGTDEYLVVTVHQVRASLKLRVFPHARTFFKCQQLSYLTRSFKAVVLDNSIIRS